MAKRAVPVLHLSGQIELILHTRCVKAGVYCIAHGIIQRFPLAKPFLAQRVKTSLRNNSVEKIQQQLVKDIYKHHGTKVAHWESLAIIAVASSSASHFIDFKSIEQKIKTTLGNTAGSLLLKYAPLSQWMPGVLEVLAHTWAIGRYADSVCRIRKIGSNWLPAPLRKNLHLPKAVLWEWTEEAFRVALPIMQKIRLQ
jgi:hypothetical protein